MCMIDMADGCVTALREREHKARKEHRCNECRRVISIGEIYTVERFLEDGRVQTHKTCEHCMVVRDWLNAECGGWVYGGVEEDIREHADEGLYGFRVKLLAIGMARCWMRKDGRHWPVPTRPKTTYELAAVPNLL